MNKRSINGICFSSFVAYIDVLMMHALTNVTLTTDTCKYDRSGRWVEKLSYEELNDLYSSN